jgi:hypothetical protein
MTLAASKAANFILSGDTDRPDQQHLVYTIGSDTTAPCITSMAALQASNDSAGWLHYLASNGKRPATEDAVFNAVTSIWPGIARDRDATHLIKKVLGSNAEKELASLLQQDSEVHEQLNDRVNDTWSHRDVQELRSEDVFADFSVELYEADISEDAVERGVLTHLPLFVALNDQDDMIEDRQPSAENYWINPVYISVIKQASTENTIKNKGKGKQKAKAVTDSSAAAGSRTR